MGVLKQWLPYVLSGISAGGQYALIAVGYTMVYGILRLINFAHGEIFMIAMYIVFYGISMSSWSPVSSWSIFRRRCRCILRCPSSWC